MDSSAAALSAQDRVGLVNSPKMQELAGPKVRARVEALRVIQSEHDELQAKFLQERAALEARYQKLYEPFYTKRFEIVNGIVEVEGGTDSSMEEGVDKLHAGKGVPDFWLMAMKTNEILAEEISEHDEEALRSLKDIKWCRIDKPKGFKLDFFFDDNPYFKNSVLTKTYHMIDDDDDVPILEKAIGTEVEWYPGKCLTQKVLKKKPKKGSKISKPMVKTEKCESFFNFFSPPDVPESEDDIDEDEAEGLQDLMEQDYEIACAIRDKIIPHAVSWFTGEAGDDLHFDDFEDEDGDDEEEEDEDEDDESEDEDEEEVKSSKKKGGRAQTGEGQQGERPPECNQQ